MNVNDDVLRSLVTVGVECLDVFEARTRLREINRLVYGAFGCFDFGATAFGAEVLRQRALLDAESKDPAGVSRRAAE